MRTIVFVFAVFSLLVIGLSSANEVECEKKSYSGSNYYGKFVITPAQDISSWKLTVTFSKRVQRLSDLHKFEHRNPTSSEGGKRLNLKTSMTRS